MTHKPGEHSYREITTQTEAWRGALEAVGARRDRLVELVREEMGRRVLFIGCGSTHYLAQFAAAYFQAITGIVCRGLPSSELLLQTDTVVTPTERPLVIALSRSGETSETVQAVEKVRRRGADALAISCYRRTALASVSTMTVTIPEGQEESFAQTRSFAAMLVAVQALAAAVAGDDALLTTLAQLPRVGAQVIERAGLAAQVMAADEKIKRISYLGSGPLYGLANEATVKMKEMSLSVAEGYHFMEFRHGPMALVDQEHLIVGLLSDRMHAYETAVLHDLAARGAHVFLLGEDIAELAGQFAGSFDLRCGLCEEARAVLFMPFLQYMAYYRALARGLDPDRPRHVVMAIRLDGTEMI
ncbi:MAG: SIS domain-containing protein [Chloroflexi bacterium]|nr:SIS domain-containing protein [Chloroflexota bacterium]